MQSEGTNLVTDNFDKALVDNYKYISGLEFQHLTDTITQLQYGPPSLLKPNLRENIYSTICKDQRDRKK